jgi:hypothetical protein
VRPIYIVPSLPDRVEDDLCCREGRKPSTTLASTSLLGMMCLLVLEFDRVEDDLCCREGRKPSTTLASTSLLGMMCLLVLELARSAQWHTYYRLAGPTCGSQSVAVSAAFTSSVAAETSIRAP